MGIVEQDEPVLATDVRYVGEPIALIAATDLDAAEAGAVALAPRLVGDRATGGEPRVGHGRGGSRSGGRARATSGSPPWWTASTSDRAIRGCPRRGLHHGSHRTRPPGLYRATGRGRHVHRGRPAGGHHVLAGAVPGPPDPGQPVLDAAEPGHRQGACLRGRIRREAPQRDGPLRGLPGPGDRPDGSGSRPPGATSSRPRTPARRSIVTLETAVNESGDLLARRAVGHYDSGAYAVDTAFITSMGALQAAGPYQIPAMCQPGFTPSGPTSIPPARSGRRRVHKCASLTKSTSRTLRPS